MAVARTGNVEAAELLLKHGAKVQDREQWGGQTALMWAAAQSQPQMIRLLLKHGAHVDERSTVRDWQRRVTAEGRPKDMYRGGLTPLLFAAREGCIDCMQALLDKHADIDLPDPDGTTALIMALLNYHWDAAKFLIEAGADVNLWDIYGQTPLYVAVDMNTPRSRTTHRTAVDGCRHRRGHRAPAARARREPQRPAEAASALSQHPQRPLSRSDDRMGHDTIAARGEGR